MNPAEKHLFSLVDWFERNGYAGWDPYDLRDHALYRKIVHWETPPCRVLLRKALIGFLELFPVVSRRALRIPKRVNAKAMGLLLSSFCRLDEIRGNAFHLPKAQEIAHWLTQNRNPRYRSLGWGYPFNWDSPVRVPENTPSSVVTSVVGDGFYALFQRTQDQKYLEVCRGICEFFLSDLQVTYRDKTSLCFSYTPLDDYQVHNANLMAGEFLLRIGNILGNQQYLDSGRACGYFAVKDYSPGDCLPYWSSKQKDRYVPGKPKNDHYHSGFEIRSIYQMWKHTGNPDFQSLFREYFKWYSENLFLENHIPKMTETDLYPVNIHTCAEAILCRSSVGKEIFSKERPNIERTIEWVHKTMCYRKGCYRYLIRKKGPFLLKSDIPFIRWGQSWMLRAFTQYAWAIGKQDV